MRFRSCAAIALLVLPALLPVCAVSLAPFDPPDADYDRDAAPPAIDGSVTDDRAIRGDAVSGDALAPDAPQPALDPPHLLRPMTAARVTNHRPSLHFTPAAGSDGTSVQVCRDRACSSVVASVDAAGDAVRVVAPLERGVYYWRAWALRAGVVASEASPTWEFFVGPRDAPTDTSWGAAPDYDGDGYADLLVGAYVPGGHSRELVFFPGGPAGLSHETAAHVVLEASIWNTLPDYVGPVGDVNGDGFMDAAVAVTVADGGPAVDMVYGGPGGPSAGAVLPIAAPAFTEDDSVGGDFDGDGYADVTFANYDPGDGPVIYRGSRDGLRSDGAIHWEEPGRALNILSIGPPLDFDGDGRGDVLVAVQSDTDAATMLTAAVYQTGPLAGPVRWLSCATCSTLGPLTGAGDLNGDGYADAITDTYAISNGNPSFETLLGGPSGLDDAGPIRELPSPPPSTPGTYATEVEVVGDLDGNGTQDLVALDGLRGDRLGMRQWLDPSRGPDGMVTVAFGRSSTGSSPGYGIPSLGDVNGDGFDDIEIRVYDRVFLGSPAGIRLDSAFVIYPERDGP